MCVCLSAASVCEPRCHRCRSIGCEGACFEPPYTWTFGRLRVQVHELRWRFLPAVRRQECESLPDSVPKVARRPIRITFVTASCCNNTPTRFTMPPRFEHDVAPNSVTFNFKTRFTQFLKSQAQDDPTFPCTLEDPCMYIQHCLCANFP